MELRLLSQQKLDRNRWDETVKTAYNSMVYGMSYYLDACCPGWYGLVKGDYEQVMVVPVKQKVGLSYAYQPLFVQQAGIFSKYPISKEDVAAFLNFIRSKMGKVKLYLTPECNHLTEGFETEVRYSQFVRLGTPMVDIRDTFSENTRRNIKKAEKNGLNIQFSIDFETVIKGFKNQSGEHVKQIGEAGFQKLHDLLYNLQNHTDCQVAQVFSRDEQLLYSAFFCGFNTTALYVKGSGTDLARNTGAAHFLMDRMIKKYNDEGYEIFDFGGANAEGVRKFNKQFGSDEFEYLCFTGGYLPDFLLKI
jgi:hypothetical protein